MSHTRSSASSPIREPLLQAVLQFVRAARHRPEVQRIALIGSLTSDKPEPKDADVLVTLISLDHLADFAELGRKLKGATQRHNRGADIFLCSSSYQYLGRTCSFRECHPRRACTGLHCHAGGHLNDDHYIVTLASDLMRHPPIELWPNPGSRIEAQHDVWTLLLEPLMLEVAKAPHGP